MPKAQGPNFLLVGMERSGTHWVTALLNAHPEISCFPTEYFVKAAGEYNIGVIGEVHLFNTLASLEPGTEGKFTRELSNYLTKHNKIFADLVPYEGKVSKEKLYEMFIQRYNELCESQRKGKKLVGEATPAYVFHLDFIDSFYPNIKKLCIIREPKDKIVSWHFNQIRKGRKTETDISDKFIVEYCEERIKKEYESLLEYNGNIYCFTYEDLTDNTKETIKGILSYLDVEINDEIINFMIEEGSFKKLNAKDDGTEGRERGQEAINSPYRKGVVGDWKNYLNDKQLKLVDEIISETRKKVFVKYKLNNP